MSNCCPFLIVFVITDAALFQLFLSTLLSQMNKTISLFQNEIYKTFSLTSLYLSFYLPIYSSAYLPIYICLNSCLSVFQNISLHIYLDIFCIYFAYCLHNLHIICRYFAYILHVCNSAYMSTFPLSDGDESGNNVNCSSIRPLFSLSTLTFGGVTFASRAAGLSQSSAQEHPSLGICFMTAKIGSHCS